MEVKIFEGKKDNVWTLYYKLIIGGRMNAVISNSPKGVMAEIRVDSKDYIHAIGLGLDVIKKGKINDVAWISPDGNYNTGVNRDSVKIHKNEDKKNVAVFTGNMAGVGAIECGAVASYLNKSGISAIASIGENGFWQVVVGAEDYYNALHIGAKFVDGHDFRPICWNDATGDVKFNVKQIADNARKPEIDEILEA